MVGAGTSLYSLNKVCSGFAEVGMHKMHVTQNLVNSGPDFELLVPIELRDLGPPCVELFA